MHPSKPYLFLQIAKGNLKTNIRLVRQHSNIMALHRYVTLSSLVRIIQRCVDQDIIKWLVIGCEDRVIQQVIIEYFIQFRLNSQSNLGGHLSSTDHPSK